VFQNGTVAEGTLQALRSAATPESRRAAGPDASRVASSTCRSGPATHTVTLWELASTLLAPSVAFGDIKPAKSPASMMRGFVLFDHAEARLLDLGFLELDMLARHRVVLVVRELLGLGAGILLGDVVVASIS